MRESVPTAEESPVVDVGYLLDAGPLTSFQRTVIALAAFSVVLDGIASQLIGFAIPAMARDWGVARGVFAPAVASGILGMCIGSACAGLVADRFGRRLTLIGCVLSFGIATCFVSLASGVASLAALRFVAALGIGGALPVATTLAAEFSPLRLRTLAITLTIVCVPGGGMFAGLLAGRILPAYGWRALFLIGGAVPILVSVWLLVALPESPRFLARHAGRWGELSRLLTRMRRPVDREAVFTDQAERKIERNRGFSPLFAPEYIRDSLALWCAFFMCLLAIYTVFSWLPAMLISAGLDSATASSGLTLYNMGGVFGAVGCAVVVTRLGSRWPMLVSCVGAAASALILREVHLQSHISLLLFGLGMHGFFVNAVQTTMFALSAHVYPTVIRATGAATALAFGRLGAVVSAFAGAFVITAVGSSGYLLMLAMAMFLAFLAVASVRHHIPALRTDDVVKTRASA
jgi:MFS transporter, AAHS family, 4-hydroxybenzoate transporter